MVTFCAYRGDTTAAKARHIHNKEKRRQRLVTLMQLRSGKDILPRGKVPAMVPRMAETVLFMFDALVFNGQGCWNETLPGLQKSPHGQALQVR